MVGVREIIGELCHRPPRNFSESTCFESPIPYFSFLLNRSMLISLGASRKRETRNVNKTINTSHTSMKNQQPEKGGRTVKCKHIDGNDFCLKAKDCPCKYIEGGVLVESIECPYNGDVQKCLDWLIDVGIEIDGGWQTFVVTEAAMQLTPAAISMKRKQVLAKINRERMNRGLDPLIPPEDHRMSGKK